jgi:hypothetical protein
MPYRFTNTGGKHHVATLRGPKNGSVTTYYVKAQDRAGNATLVDTPVTVVVTRTGQTLFTAALEGEAGHVVAPMETLADKGASGGRYVASETARAGSATFDLNVPVAGDYFVWARVFSIDTGHDSFFVSVDGADEQEFHALHAVRPGFWQWSHVYGNGSEPRLFKLAAGKHRLKQIACIHGTFGFTRAHNGMQFINEHDDFAFALFYFI